MLSATFLLGCSPHKLEIQQGNIITDEMLSQLKPGMTVRQVRFLLGSPQLTDPFHHNRWDYVYSLKQDGKRIDYKRLTLYFEGDILARIEQNSDD